jgi:hypothetical protein
MDALGQLLSKNWWAVLASASALVVLIVRIRKRRSGKPGLPKASDFPPATRFVIKEFDVPLVQVPAEGWFNWYGGTPRPYDPSALRVDNNWPAESFEEWLAVVAASTRPSSS